MTKKRLSFTMEEMRTMVERLETEKLQDIADDFDCSEGSIRNHLLNNFAEAYKIAVGKRKKTRASKLGKSNKKASKVKTYSKCGTEELDKAFYYVQANGFLEVALVKKKVLLKISKAATSEIIYKSNDRNLGASKYFDTFHELFKDTPEEAFRAFKKRQHELEQVAMKNIRRFNEQIDLIKHSTKEKENDRLTKQSEISSEN